MRKNIPFYLLFLFSLCINLFYCHANISNVPFVHPDTKSYTDITNQIVDHQTPNFQFRSITYPLFVAPFVALGNINLIIFANIILGSIAPIFLFQIIFTLTKNKIFSFITTIFLALNYSVSIYQTTLLSESITPFLFLLSFLLHIKLINRNFTKKSFVLLLIVDILLIGTKPSLCFLPIIFYVITYFFTKSKNQIILIGILASFSVILVQSGINQIQNHFFGISEVGQANLLGKNIQYGFLDKQYNTQNPDIQKVLRTYNEVIVQEKQSTDPYLIIFYRLLRRYEITYPITNFLKPVNNYFIENNKSIFLKKSILLSIQNFTSPRTTQPWHHPEYIGNSVKMIDNVFTFIAKLQLAGFILSLFILIYFIYHKKKEAFYLSLILASILSTIIFISFLSYCEYDRLMAHIIYLMNFTVIYPVYFLISRCYTRNK